MPDEENAGLDERDETLRRLSQWARGGGADRRGGGEEPPHDTWAAFEEVYPCIRRGALFWIPNPNLGIEIEKDGYHPVMVVRSSFRTTDSLEEAMGRNVEVSIRSSWKEEQDGPTPLWPRKTTLRGRKYLFTLAGGPFNRPGRFELRPVPVPARILAEKFMGWLEPREVAQAVVACCGGGAIEDPYPPESCL